MARSFNGSTDEISMGTASILRPTAVSLSCWANTNSLASTYENIAGVADGGGGIYQILIKSTGKVAYYVLSVNATIDVDPGSGTVSLNTWNHFALTYDSVNGLKTFLNGVSDGTFAANGIINTAPVRAFVVGWQATLSRFFSGSVADVASWSTNLTQTEITALAKGARPFMIRTGSLIGYWPLDGLQSPEPDFSGNANNGALTGTSLGFGPPLMQFTPRSPHTLIRIPPVVAATFNPARTMRANLAYIGYPTM